MPAAKQKRRSEPSKIDPQVLYTLREFQRATGLGPTSMRKARAAGVELKTLRVGRCKYARGADVIQFIERAAAI
ncbi:hypothetical protein [Botrimarina hoheduenensis]|uniref:Uncharacterized protein n=1 Tax=Botrimarina hoheduenensis TaxID=2528000 RepID=A0A5C5VXY8_9BACT|nr:hypothetical protein [Botrimarina hoheduenensis]TWT42581.1 hypothetical protein Pla111_28870 [Botrimarina hoheduenensis]